MNYPAAERVGKVRILAISAPENENPVAIRIRVIRAPWLPDRDLAALWSRNENPESWAPENPAHTDWRTTEEARGCFRQDLKGVLDVQAGVPPSMNGMVLYGNLTCRLQLKHAFDELFDQRLSQAGWSHITRLTPKQVARGNNR